MLTTRLAFDRDKHRNLEFGILDFDFFYGLGMIQGYQLDHSGINRHALSFFIGGIFYLVVGGAGDWNRWPGIQILLFYLTFKLAGLGLGNWELGLSIMNYKISFDFTNHFCVVVFVSFSWLCLIDLLI